MPSTSRADSWPGQEWLFAKAFENAAARRGAREIHHRAEHDHHALAAFLRGHGLAPALHEISIPSRRERYWRGKCGHAAEPRDARRAISQAERRHATDGGHVSHVGPAELFPARASSFSAQRPSWRRCSPHDCAQRRRDVRRARSAPGPAGARPARAELPRSAVTRGRAQSTWKPTSGCAIRVAPRARALAPGGRATAAASRTRPRSARARRRESSWHSGGPWRRRC